MRITSLCSGYEGLGMAVSAVVGGDLAFVADIDPGACALLAHRFPGVPNVGDIKAVDWISLGAVDVLCGGFPCQDVSAAGARAGLKRGNRSGLWHEFVAAICTLRPSLVVIENVLGLLTARGDEPTAEHLAVEASRDSAGRLLEWLENELDLAVSKGNARRARQCRARIARLRKLWKRAADRCQWHERRLIRAIGTVLASLAALGYDAEWVVVTASAAGACHRRARLFILAFPACGRAVAGVPAAVTEDGTWLEPRESLFGVLPFTGRIPASGSMAGGRVYAAPDAPTNMTAGLLKTPTAQLAVNGGSQHPDKRRAGGHGPTLADQVEHELLPTPMAADGGWAGDADGKGARASSSGYGLRNTSREIAAGDHLLPTPTAREKGGRNARHGDTGHGDDLPEAVRYLPTPNASDGKGASAPAGRDRSDGRTRTAGDADLPEAVALLPTPAARDGKGRDMPGREGGKSLPETLLPTPNATDGQGGPRALPGRRTSRGKDHGPRLRDVAPTLSDVCWDWDEGDQGMPLPVAARHLAGETDWGPYETAIRHWEVATGRPAPAPTVPGKTGQRLNPALPEWMMGLPAGWITEVPGLSRNAMLKLAGNGVVPQQAELALRLLLDRADLEFLGRAA
jgi:DNA (cytosine-5)-methyltransferase 1